MKKLLIILLLTQIHLNAMDDVRLSENSKGPILILAIDPSPTSIFANGIRYLPESLKKRAWQDFEQQDNLIPGIGITKNGAFELAYFYQKLNEEHIREHGTPEEKKLLQELEKQINSRR